MPAIYENSGHFVSCHLHNSSGMCLHLAWTNVVHFCCSSWDLVLNSKSGPLFPHCPVKIAIFRGLGGVPQIFFRHKSYFFCELGPHTKFHNPRTTPSGRKVCDPERKKEERKIMPNFRSRRWGSSLPGLRTRDPPLSPPSTWAEIFRRACLQSHLKKSPQTHRS